MLRLTTRLPASREIDCPGLSRARPKNVVSSPQRHADLAGTRLVQTVRLMTPAQKAARIARARAHLDNNRLQPGTLFGGSVACDVVDILGAERATQVDSEHFSAIIAAHDGTAEWLEQLRDMVVNSWPDQQRFQWHLAFAEALPVERDLTPCYHRICLELLQIAISNSSTWPANARASTVDLIERISALHRRQERDEIAWHAAKVLGEAAWLVAETAVKQAFTAEQWRRE